MTILLRDIWPIAKPESYKCHFARWNDEHMKPDERYKDVTFETLNREDFLESVKAAFPKVDWDKAYWEFRAAGEVKKDSGASSTK